MATRGRPSNAASGPLAPALVLVLAAVLSVCGPPAAAQQAPAQPALQPPPAAAPVPGQLELSKLIWSTLAAVDHANLSGNYSVLRDMSAQGFQISNDAARLAQIFAGIRSQGIDLSNTLVLPPTYLEAPKQIRPDLFEVRGIFQLRPTAIYFDLVYQWEQGRWKLYGIAIQPVTIGEAMPGESAPPAQQPPRQQDPRR